VIKMGFRLLNINNRTRGNEIKEGTNMNILRHIFSFMLVVVLAIVAAVMAAPRPAIARVKCPCPFTLMYTASIVQSKALGYTNRVDRCTEFKQTNTLILEGGEFENPSIPCYTNLRIKNVTFMYCEVEAYCINDTFGNRDYEVLSDPALFPSGLTAQEVAACRAELKAIAKLSHILPCQQFP
jgi:hypothetical protein